MKNETRINKLIHNDIYIYETYNNACVPILCVPIHPLYDTIWVLAKSASRPGQRPCIALHSESNFRGSVIGWIIGYIILFDMHTLICVCLSYFVICLPFLFVWNPSGRKRNLVVGWKSSNRNRGNALGVEGTVWGQRRERVEGQGWQRVGGWGWWMEGSDWGVRNGDGERRGRVHFVLTTSDLPHRIHRLYIYL